ncbi:MAG TPA: hypothetical protein VJT31_16900 [Rugosimonospora sp.]|nr:hypothetical protein [Rugosimonospora sp.]
MTTPRFLPAVALLLSAAALAIAGCNAGTGTDTTNAARSKSAPAGGVPAASATGAANPGPSAAGSYQDQVMAWGRQFAACARSHGNPTFPDPVYPANAQPTGLTWGFSLFANVDKPTLSQAANGPCSDIARQMPPAPDALHPPNATTLTQMRQFAQCMRQHGQSDFPDPKTDGTFPILNTPYEGLSPLSPQHPSPAMGDARRACRQYQNDWDIRAS